MDDPKAFYMRRRKAELYKAYRRPLPENFVVKTVNFLSKTFSPSECDAADVGCGSGQATLPLAPFLGNIVGIEVSQAQLDQVDQSLIPDNVQFQIGESDHLPFDDSSLHLVNVKSALHWFDIPKFFQEVDRVLKPGGVLAVSHGGGTFQVVGHKDEARQLMREMFRTKPLTEERSANLQLVRNNYKDIDFPYREVIRDESYSEVYSETVADVVRFWTCMGGFDVLLEEASDQTDAVVNEAQDKLMNLLALEGSPEEARTQIKYDYLLVLCRKPL